MPFKNIILGFSAGLLLSACASDPVDPLEPTRAGEEHFKPQCPIGFEPVYSTAIVVSSTDKDKKPGDTTRDYECKPAG